MAANRQSFTLVIGPDYDVTQQTRSDNPGVPVGSKLCVATVNVAVPIGWRFEYRSVDVTTQGNLTAARMETTIYMPYNNPAGKIKRKVWRTAFTNLVSRTGVTTRTQQYVPTSYTEAYPRFISQPYGSGCGTSARPTFPFEFFTSVAISGGHIIGGYTATMAEIQSGNYRPPTAEPILQKFNLAWIKC
jgi:hypothetical protein